MAKQYKNKPTQTAKKFEKPTPLSVTKTFTNIPDIIMELIRIDPGIKKVFYIDPAVPDNITDIGSEPLAIDSNISLYSATFDDCIDIVAEYFFKVAGTPHIIEGCNFKNSFQCSGNKICCRPNGDYAFEIKVKYHLEPLPSNPRRKYTIPDEYYVKYTTYTGDTQKINTAEDLGWDMQSDVHNM